jgi:hypothetical protein
MSEQKDSISNEKDWEKKGDRQIFQFFPILLWWGGMLKPTGKEDHSTIYNLLVPTFQSLSSLCIFVLFPAL